MRLPLSVALLTFSFAIVPVLAGYLLRAWHERRWRHDALGKTGALSPPKRPEDRRYRPPRTRWFWLFPASTIAGGAGGLGAALLLSPLLLPLSLSAGRLIGFDNLHEYLAQPLCEELGKALPLLLIYRTRWFRDALDGMLLGMAAGLGFAAFENLLFFLAAYDRGGLPAWAASIAVRIVLSTAVHGTASAFVGAYFGAAREHPSQSVRLLALPAGLAAAVGLHASWNGLITSAQEEAGTGLALTALGLLSLCLMACFLLFRRAIRPAVSADTLTTREHQIERM